MELLNGDIFMASQLHVAQASQREHSHPHC